MFAKIYEKEPLCPSSIWSDKSLWTKITIGKAKKKEENGQFVNPAVEIDEWCGIEAVTEVMGDESRYCVETEARGCAGSAVVAG